MEKIKIQCTEAQLTLIAGAIAHCACGNRAFEEGLGYRVSHLTEAEALFERSEPPRWRADKDGEYWYVSDFGDAKSANDDHDGTGYCYWDCGNYFKTRAEAKAAAAKWRELFGNEQKTTQ